MSTIADLDTSRADIKSTPTGLVEYNNGTSLEAVIEILRNLLATSRIPTVADDAALAALTGDESLLAFKTGSGLYCYSATDLGSGIESVDGGFWNLDNYTLLTALVYGTPTEGKAPLWSEANSRPEWGVPTVDELGWVNITSKPSQITGIASTDVLVKLFNAASNKGIGISTVGNGNTIFAPLGHSVTSASNSTLILSKNLTHMTTVNDSTIITDAVTLRPGTTPFTVNRCIIIGECGDLSAYFVSDELNDVMVVGMGGAPVFVKNLAGKINILSGSGAGIELVSDPLLVGGNLTVNGAMVANGGFATAGGDAFVDGDLAVNGHTTLSDYIKLASWATGGRPGSPAAGMLGFNTTLTKIEYYNGTTWVALP